MATAPPIVCFDPMHPDQLCVQLEQIHFSYTAQDPLLNSLNVRVPRGGVYSLLGPSSCGKSTVLKLILGLLRPERGKVRVHGRQPNTPRSSVPGPGVGYMPQDLSLMTTLTVRDYFHFYGTMNGLTVGQVRSSYTSLVQLLQLPIDRRVCQLSGGQQRRASLAIALLHSPPLLVLDEPTVGVDPIMRNLIWDHMIKLTKEQCRTVRLAGGYLEPFSGFAHFLPFFY